MNTTTIRAGKVTVLAKDNGNPYTYTNYTQAEKRAIKLQSLGLKASVVRSSCGKIPLFVSIG